MVVPGDKGLAITAINPRPFSGEVIAQRVRFRAFAANYGFAGARHWEVCLMFEAMNFDNIS